MSVNGQCTDMMNNTDFALNDIVLNPQSSGFKSVDECRSICDSLTECLVAVYKRAFGECYPKSALGSESIANKETDAYFKYCSEYKKFVYGSKVIN